MDLPRVRNKYNKIYQALAQSLSHTKHSVNISYYHLGHYSSCHHQCEDGDATSEMVPGRRKQACYFVSPGNKNHFLGKRHSRTW